MPDGPFGAAGTPLAEVIRAAARLAGHPVDWTEDGSLHVLRGSGVALVANVGPLARTLPDAPNGNLPPDSVLVLEVAA
jgi:hypothetical protein